MLPNGIKFQPTVEKCVFDRQFLSRSYLLNFSSNFTITVAIRSYSKDLVVPARQELFLYVKY